MGDAVRLGAPAVSTTHARPSKVSFFKPLALYAAAAGVDYASTRYLIAHGGREVVLPTQNAAGQAAIKAGAALLLAATDYSLQRSGHKKTAKVARIAIPILWSLAAAHNVKQAGKGGVK